MGGGSFDMGSKVRYSLTNNAVLLSDNNGIINVNYADYDASSSDGGRHRQMSVNKKLYFNEKYCYEFIINSSVSEHYP